MPSGGRQDAVGLGAYFHLLIEEHPLKSFPRGNGGVLPLSPGNGVAV
jgi:hypothetical protein